MKRQDTRRYRWKDETHETKVGLLCDDFDELEVQVTQSVESMTRELEKVGTRLWGLIALVIAALLSVIATLLLAQP